MTNEQTTLSLLEQLSAKVDALHAALRASLQVPEFYSIKQAAKVVSVSADHVRRAVVAGALAASNVGTMARPTYRIARAALLAWVEACKAGAAAPARRKKAVTPTSRHHPRPGGRSGGPGS